MIIKFSLLDIIEVNLVETPHEQLLVTKLNAETAMESMEDPPSVGVSSTGYTEENKVNEEEHKMSYTIGKIQELDIVTEMELVEDANPQVVIHPPSLGNSSAVYTEESKDNEEENQTTGKIHVEPEMESIADVNPQVVIHSPSVNDSTTAEAKDNDDIKEESQPVEDVNPQVTINSSRICDYLEESQTYYIKESTKESENVKITGTASLLIDSAIQMIEKQLLILYTIFT